MSVTPLSFSSFVDTTDSEQRWQIYNAIQGQTGLAENVTVVGSLPAGSNAIGYLSSPSSFTAGQQAVTASAAALPSASLTTGVVFTNGSSAIVYIGGSSVTSSTGYALAVGSSVGLVVAQLSSVYIIGTASSGNLSYIGS